TGTVTLSNPAPAGGVSVALSDNDAAVSVPAAASVAAGQTSGTFTVTTSAVTAQHVATISASNSGVAKSATLTVNPGASATYSISGTVSSSAGGLAGATVSTTGATAATATDGSYTLTNLPAGTYSVTASK